MRTTTTPMMKSAAVSASDSASTDRPPTSENDRAGNCDEEEHAGQLKRQQIVLEKRRGDSSHRVQLRQLLLVEITGDDQLLRQLRAQDDPDLAEKAEADESGRQLPAESAGVRQLGGMPEIEKHHHEQENHHDCAGIHQDLHHAD